MASSFVVMCGTIVLLGMVCRGADPSPEPRMIPQSFPGRCRRAPPGVMVPKTPGDNGFYIKVSGNPEKYQPGEVYTVTLQGYSSQYMVRKFVGFMLMVEPKEVRNDISVRTDVGYFLLLGDQMSKYSEDCPNAIVHANSIPKQIVQVTWKAPRAQTGCVVFKASVQESRDVWYMDEGSLIREICEEEQENRGDQPTILNKCCACEEAKYEITFEGLWSRHTHPKDFPTNEWLTHFSDIIGASHSVDFKMWDYGGFASEGVKEVAENGVTTRLESELKTHSEKIRTIVKARGLRYPHVQSRTFAVFRVDNVHHLVSVLTKMGPSPDWIVGVSSLELCRSNGSWVPKKIMNLNPWDAGTDSGLSYESPRMPSQPQEKIRSISSSNPNTPLSPFYDSSGIPLKPVARLIFTRQRVYEKECDQTCLKTTKKPSVPQNPDVVNTEEDSKKRECQVSDWTDWSECSVTCGQGHQTRQREYFNKGRAKKAGCSVPVVETEMCTMLCVNNISCQTTEWGEFQECSVTCGKGVRIRKRKYVDSRAHKTACGLDLMEKETCVGMKSTCDVDPAPDPKCATTHWSEWSPCTVTCGKGVKMRTRLYLSPAAIATCDVELMQKAPCSSDRPDCTLDLTEARKNCMQPKEVGPCRGYFPRWYYDTGLKMCQQFIYGGCRGNRNNFERYGDCNRMCEAMLLRAPLEELTSTLSTSPVLPVGVTVTKEQPEVVDCVVTPWSDWSPCSSSCDNGRRERRRMIKKNPENGGTPCPAKLVQRRKCKENPSCCKYL